MTAAHELVNIGPWGGVNLQETPSIIKDQELASCVNFSLGREGELVKRTGFETLYDGAPVWGLNDVKLIGHFTTSTYSQLIARVGANLYYSNDAITWTLIGAYAVEYGVQYADTFYMVRKGNTLLAWTGTGTPTAITGSPGGDYCIVHKERLFVFDSTGTSQSNSRVYFSLPGDFSATGWVSTNTFDVAKGDGDFLVGGAIVNDVLVLFKTRGTWGLYVQGSSSADWMLRSLNSRIGCMSKYTVKVIDGICYFVAPEGVYRTDGTLFKNIAENIQPIFTGRVATLSATNIEAAFFWDDNYVVLIKPNVGALRYFTYNLGVQGWTEWAIAGGFKPSFFVEVRANLPNPGVYAGDANLSGKVYRFGSNVYTDGGVAYQSSLKTKNFTFDMPVHMKRGKWLGVRTVGVASIVAVHTVNGSVEISGEVNSEALAKVQKLVGPGFFRSWTLTLTVTSTGAFQLLGLVLFLHKKRSQIGASV